MTSNEAIKLLHSTLKPVQKEMFSRFLGYNGGRKYVIHASRRLGKSWLLCVLAIIFAISKSNAQVRYASVSQKAVRKMIFPIMKELFSKLPKTFKGKWNSIEGAYIFPNGSFIHVAGVNNGHEDDLRGSSTDGIAIVDEAAFCDNLEYLVESVLMPQLITSNGGKLIMASSSPLSPAHEFTSYIRDAKVGGYYSSFDINAGGYSQEIVDEFLKECGGASSTTARREYFNELIVDDQLSIIPEWNASFAQEISRDEFYPYYQKYESADWGVRDNTVILFMYYDFKKAKLIVENEFVTNGPESTTRNIANAITKIEAELGWSNPKDIRRVADSNEARTLMDLGSEFGIYFSPVEKAPGSKNQMINAVRLLIQDGRIIVNPRCKNLLGCLEFGVFADSKRNNFGRAKDLGHYDALDSLCYGVSVLDQTTNPIPTTYATSIYTHFTPPAPNPTHDNIKKIFNL